MTERDRNPDILATADRLAEMTGGFESRRDAIYDALASSSASGAAWRPIQTVPMDETVKIADPESDTRYARNIARAALATTSTGKD